MRALIAALCLALPLAAQQPPSGSQGPGRMQYDTSQEVTLQGTVSSVRSQAQGPGKMVSLTLQTQAKAYQIMVGPDFMLKSKGLTLASGDEISVICAPMGPGYMARQITRGSDTYTFLDSNGQPTGGPSGGDQGSGPQGPPPQQ
nr:hypothetical protein [uncultured Holophaga sp.]